MYKFSKLLIESESPKNTGEQEGHQKQNNKWGTEGRILFEADQDTIQKLKSNGYRVKENIVYKGELPCRINNIILFDKMISHGLEAGKVYENEKIPDNIIGIAEYKKMKKS